MKKILGVLITSAIILTVLYYVFIYFVTYSTGVRSGELIKISRKGVLVKTWEGEISQGISGAQIFAFSVEDKTKKLLKIYKNIKENMWNYLTKNVIHLSFGWAIPNILLPKSQEKIHHILEEKINNKMKKFKSIEESQLTITELMLPSHSNFSGKIHGGHILNLMDQIAFACASKHSSNYCVTASVNKVDFLNPIEVGELLTLKASVNYTGRTSMVVGLRVESENIRTGEKKHCNSSYFTMVAKDENGKSTPVPGIILTCKDEIRRYARSIIRQKEGRNRTSRFSTNTFKTEDYLELLAQSNSKIELKD